MELRRNEPATDPLLAATLSTLERAIVSPSLLGPSTTLRSALKDLAGYAAAMFLPLALPALFFLLCPLPLGLLATFVVYLCLVLLQAWRVLRHFRARRRSQTLTTSSPEHRAALFTAIVVESPSSRWTESFLHFEEPPHITQLLRDLVELRNSRFGGTSVSPDELYRALCVLVRNPVAASSLLGACDLIVDPLLRTFSVTSWLGVCVDLPEGPALLAEFLDVTLREAYFDFNRPGPRRRTLSEDEVATASQHATAAYRRVLALSSRPD